MGRRRNKIVTQHHLRNRSRFPPNTSREDMDTDNIVELDDDFHFHWHQCMKNLSPEEAIRFIKLVMQPNTHWNHHDLARARFYVMTTKENT